LGLQDLEVSPCVGHPPQKQGEPVPVDEPALDAPGPADRLFLRPQSPSAPAAQLADPDPWGSPVVLESQERIEQLVHLRRSRLQAIAAAGPSRQDQET